MDDFGEKNYVNALMRYSYFDKQVGYFIIMRKVSKKKKLRWFPVLAASYIKQV